MREGERGLDDSRRRRKRKEKKEKRRRRRWRLACPPAPPGLAGEGRRGPGLAWGAIRPFGLFR